MLDMIQLSNRAVVTWLLAIAALHVFLFCVAELVRA